MYSRKTITQFALPYTKARIIKERLGNGLISGRVFPDKKVLTLETNKVYKPEAMP